jgi:hypothetical protein
MNKVCVTCHQELPIALFREITVKGITKHQGRCKPCGRAYQRAYYEQHKDRIKLQVKEWHKQRPDYIKDWMKNNPEKVKLHKENHRPKRLQYSRERYWADPETAKQKSKEYRDANPELMRERKQKWIQSSREHLRSYYNGLTKNLSDSYIRGKLARKSKRKEILSAKDIPQELVELKRFEILIKRELKKCNTSAN